jgi:hypothetical protein
VRALLIILALSVTVACETAVQVVPGGGGGALIGPWQAEPFPIAGPLLQAIDQACRGSMQEFPPQVQVTVIDARGGGRIQAHYTSPDGAEATCVDMSVDAAGHVEAAGGGGVGFGGQPRPPLQAHELMNAGGMGSNESNVTYGRAGAGINKVVLLMPGHVPVAASFANGWYLVWWPGDWPPGTKLVGLDVLGQQVAETTVP